MAAVGAVVTVRASRGPAIVVPTDVLVEEEVTRGGEPAHGTGQSGGARCAAHQGPQQANLRHLQRHATCYSGASGVGQRATQSPNFSILGVFDAFTADSLLTLKYSISRTFIQNYQQQHVKIVSPSLKCHKHRFSSTKRIFNALS